MPPSPRPPKPKKKTGTTFKTRTNTSTGIGTTVTVKDGIPTHVNQWDIASGKRTLDRDLPMKLKN